MDTGVGGQWSPPAVYILPRATFLIHPSKTVHPFCGHWDEFSQAENTYSCNNSSCLGSEHFSVLLSTGSYQVILDIKSEWNCSMAVWTGHGEWRTPNMLSTKLSDNSKAIKIDSN